MRRAVLVAIATLAWAGPYSAVAATDEEAQRLVDSFHQYLGTPRAGASDHVQSHPEGDAYRVSLNLDLLAQPLKQFGVTVEGAEVSFLTQPLPDGTWRVTDLRMPRPLTIAILEQTIKYRFEGMRFEGIYDPEIATFLSFEQTMETTESEIRDATSEAIGHIGEQTVQGTATDDGTGAVNMVMHQTLRDIRTRQTMSPPSTDPKAPALPSFEFSYQIDSGVVDATIESWELRKLLDLWAYGLALVQDDAPTPDERELKALVTDLLPVFRRLEATYALEGLHVQTPVGEFGIEHTNYSMMLMGVVPDSVTRMSFKLAGPSYPEELAPAWAADLVPTDLELGFEISGIDFNAPARLIIEKFNAESDPPLAPADGEAALELMLPEGQAKLVLQSTHLDGPLVDIVVDGGMTLEVGGVEGAFNVTVTGLDSAIASLSGTTGDLMASQALGFLTLAQSMGRQTGDGATYFQFEISKDRGVTLNGQVLVPPNSTAL